MKPDITEKIEIYRTNSVYVEVRTLNGGLEPTVNIQHPLSTASINVPVKDLDDLTEVLMAITSALATAKHKERQDLISCAYVADMTALADELERRQSAHPNDAFTEPEY